MAQQEKETAGAPSNNPLAVAYRHWGKKLIAAVIVIAMVASVASYYFQTRTDEILSAPAEVENDGGTVTVSDVNARERMEAIGSAVDLQDALNADYQNAMALIEEGEYAQAVPMLEELYTYLSEDESVGMSLRMTLAELYYLTDAYNDCHNMCCDIIDRGEDTGGTYTLLDGLALMNSEDYERSITMLEKALEAGYSDEGTVRSQIMLDYYYMGDYDAAAEAGEALLGSEAGDEVANVVHYIVAMSLLQQGSYQASLEHFDALIEALPDGEYYYDRGVAEMALEDYESAAADYLAALDAGYDTTACWYNYAISAYMNADYEAAVEAFQTVAGRDDDMTYVTAAQEILDELTAAAETAAE